MQNKNDSKNVYRIQNASFRAEVTFNSARLQELQKKKKKYFRARDAAHLMEPWLHALNTVICLPHAAIQDAVVPAGYPSSS